MTVRTTNATITLRETAEFNHKAILVLRDYGTTRADMVRIMGLSERTVRRYLNSPCPAYEIEKQEAEERRKREAYNRTRRGHIRFWREDDYLTEKAIYLRGLRAEIERLWAEDMSQTGIAFELGISRQVVGYHLKMTVEKASRKVAKPCVRNSVSESHKVLSKQEKYGKTSVQKIYI
ncbi:hypothetical protein [Rhizobium rhizogenes]|uniref:hypothetical protein n=1 Tax=Rhizobium rhizogenes TaxID=359 RepID=UPI0022BD363D|nr:hypothetical protein [Rhizobium rhizogenes]MCZ7453504.1 hypothetical protein [Rhizobium rhizogenes]